MNAIDYIGKYIDLKLEKPLLPRLEFVKNKIREMPCDKKIIAAMDLSYYAITKKVRKVFRSNEFFCPEKYVSGLKNLITKIENGVDIRAHQRKYKLSNRERINSDYSLYDWGVHHLHLGENLDSGGMIKRTGGILFCFITEDRFYLIAVKPHTFHDQEILEIIHKNWPRLISHYRLNLCVGLQSGGQRSPGDLSDLRNNNIQAFFQIPNTDIVYFMYGYSADGSSTYIVLGKFNALKRALEGIKIKNIRESLPEINHDSIISTLSKSSPILNEFIEKFNYAIEG